MPSASRVAGLTIVLVLALCAPASAASFAVDNGGDGHDRNPGDGICDGSPNGDPAFCTLRAAVEEANALAGTDQIDFQVSDVQLTLGSGLGAIEIKSDMTIAGNGAESTIISQQSPPFQDGGDRVFDVEQGAKVILTRLQVRGGEANPSNGFFGGNIRSSGELVIEDSSVTGGSGYSGGGISNNSGALTVRRSAVFENTALSGGGDAGGILNFGGDGGGPATLTIENSTISSNQASLAGGVFSRDNEGNVVTVTDSTIAFNDSGSRGLGAGLFIGSGSASVNNSIVANNTSSLSPDSQNCTVGQGATLTSGGYNLENATDCGFTQNTDAQNTDPRLDGLGFTNSETPTHALLPDSPAIDTGDPGCPSEDQRLEPRPKGEGCDKGAFEADPQPFKHIASAGPLEHIWLGEDLTCQVHYAGDAGHSFYEPSSVPGSCATRLRVNGADLFPSLSEQSKVTGSGTRSDPFKVVTTAELSDGCIECGERLFAQEGSGISIQRTDTYVVGDDFYRSDVEVSNSTDEDVSALLWHWADCYLQDDDFGFGYFDSPSGGVYCAVNPNNSPAARIEGLVPLSGGAHWYEGNLETASSPSDNGYPDKCCEDAEAIDNGMGISWNFSLPAGGLEKRSFLTAFSPTGDIVDTAAPDTSIIDGPSGVTNDSTPTFSFSSSEAGSSFECSVDGGTFGACNSPQTAGALGDGAHTFAVRATDSSGNQDATPAARAITVDTSPPDTTVEGGPTGSIDDHTPTFSFSTPEPGSRFECSIDGGPFGPCSSPFTTGRLPAGKHTLSVRAVDAAGNPDPTPSVFEFEIQAQTVAELPDPKPGVTINVQELKGTVLIGIPTSAAAARSGHASQKGIKFVPLSEAEQIPVGSFLDTRRGTVRLQSAKNAAGDRQTGDFLSSIFQVRQSKRRSAKGLTDLVLKGGSFNRCGSATEGKRGKRASASLSRRTIRRLRSNARGRFRTSGRNSSATVRGTRWETIDRCDGTLTKVQRGTVVVRDFRRKKNVVLKAGKSYLARARR